MDWMGGNLLRRKYICKNIYLQKNDLQKYLLSTIYNFKNMYLHKYVSAKVFNCKHNYLQKELSAKIITCKNIYLQKYLSAKEILCRNIFSRKKWKCTKSKPLVKLSFEINGLSSNKDYVEGINIHF